MRVYVLEVKTPFIFFIGELILNNIVKTFKDRAVV